MLNYDVTMMAFTSNDLERLKVQVTNGPMMAIDTWGYTAVQLTGVLVCILFVIIFLYLCDLRHSVDRPTMNVCFVLQPRCRDSSVLDDAVN